TTAKIIRTRTVCPWGLCSFTITLNPARLSRPPGLIIIIYEANFGRRQIFTDGRPLPNNPPEPYPAKHNPPARGNIKVEKKGIHLMRYRRWFLAGMFVASVLASARSLVPASTIRTIDVPGATDTGARGINERGQIVGRADTHGFL